MNRPARRAALPALGLAGIMSLTGCTNAEPGRDVVPTHTQAIEISIAGDDREQMILGEVYSQVLHELGRSTSLALNETPHDRTRLEELRLGETDMIVGCTGVLLSVLDPLRAEELSEEIEAGEVDDPMDRTYQEFRGALSWSMTTPDPSSAQGCAEEARAQQTPDLPQSIVPVYHRELLSRGEVEEINNVTRLLTTADLEALIEDADEKSSVSKAVSDWLG